MKFCQARRPAGRLEPIGVAVVGCGYWGRNYTRVINELACARVASVCDAFVERLEAIATSFPDVHVTSDLEEALGRLDVQAAIVATPPSTHFEVAKACLERGLHVLIEKPMTTRSRDAGDLIRLAESSGLTLMAGHTFLYNRGVRKVKEYLDSGDIGRLYYLYARRTNLGPIRTDVNAVWDLAPHDISIFDFLLGTSPEWVSAIGSCLLCDDREDVGFVSLMYPHGIPAHVHVSWADPNKTREVVLVGSDKRIVFNDLNPLEPVRVFDKGVCRPEASTYGEFTFLLRDGDIVSPMIEASEPLKAQCEHFLECVRTGKRPLTDGHSGQRVVEVIEAIDGSLRRRGAPVLARSLDESPHEQVAHDPAAVAAR